MGYDYAIDDVLADIRLNGHLMSDEAIIAAIRQAQRDDLKEELPKEETPSA